MQGAAQSSPRLWISGKGLQPKGSKVGHGTAGLDPARTACVSLTDPLRIQETAGTKKEISYLRCLSDCLAQCKKPGYGREKDAAECLEQCQDFCCSSYEQCTYTLKPE
jgi:hypothetical protein